MRKGDSYTVMFALAVCAVCSVILSVASSGLRDRQELNVELDRQINVLKSFGIFAEKDEVEYYFDNYITELDVAEYVDDSVEPMPLYLWKEDGQVKMYAFPVAGRGLWSLIRGYLALQADLDTIQGITFYEHGETPGLGAEIDQRWFQEQFEGKQIRSNGELVRFRVVKGRVADQYPQGNPHAVDGISGATMTARGVEDFMNEDIRRYNAYFETIREDI